MAKTHNFRPIEDLCSIALSFVVGVGRECNMRELAEVLERSQHRAAQIMNVLIADGLVLERREGLARLFRASARGKRVAHRTASSDSVGASGAVSQLDTTEVIRLSDRIQVLVDLLQDFSARGIEISGQVTVGPPGPADS